MNWSLNIYPLLQPGLFMLYVKIHWKIHPHAHVWVNNAMRHELLWFVQHVENMTGIYMMSSIGWGLDVADIQLFTDACPSGLGFWLPSLSLGFQWPIHTGNPYGIFYLEALAVVSTLEWVIDMVQPIPKHVVIFCNNSNTVNMFNTL
jgi:hypothetical protein